MLCEKVLGNKSDEAFLARVAEAHGGPVTLDFVDFDWHEVFKRLHRKTSEAGREVGVRLEDWVLSRGLCDGDVLGIEITKTGPVLVVVRLLSLSCLVIHVAEDHPFMLARVGWEIGNTHTPLFYGDSPFELVCEHTNPMERLLGGLHAVTIEVEDRVLDPARRISLAAHSHSHDHVHDHGFDHAHDHCHTHDHGQAIKE